MENVSLVDTLKQTVKIISDICTDINEFKMDYPPRVKLLKSQNAMRLHILTIFLIGGRITSDSY
jgi:hypothetical protein